MARIVAVILVLLCLVGCGYDVEAGTVMTNVRLAIKTSGIRGYNQGYLDAKKGVDYSQGSMEWNNTLDKILKGETYP